MPTTDGYKVAKGNPLREQHEVLDRLLKEYDERIGGSYFSIKIQRSRAARDILSADRETQSKTVDALIARLEPLENRFNDLYRRARAENDYNVHMRKGWDAIRSPQSVLIELLRALLKRDLPLSADTMLRLLNWLSGSGAFNSHWYPIVGVIKNFEHFAKNNPVTPKLAKAATAFCKKLAKEIGEQKTYKLRQRIERALATSSAVPSPAPAPRNPTMQNCKIETQSAQLLDAFNKAWARDRTCDIVALKKSPGAQAILQADPEVRMSAIGHILELIGDFAQRGKKSGDPERWFSQKGFPWGSVYLARMLLQKALPFRDDDLKRILECVVALGFIATSQFEFVDPLIGTLERHAATDDLSPQLQALAQQLSNNVLKKGAPRNVCGADASDRKIGLRLQALVKGSPKSSVPSKAAEAPSVHLDNSAMELADKLLKRIEGKSREPNYWKFDANDAGVKALFAAELPIQAAAVLQTAERLRRMAERLAKAKRTNESTWWNLWHERDYPGPGVKLASLILRRKLPFSEKDYEYLVERLAAIPAITLHSVPIAENIIALIEKHVSSGGSVDTFCKNLRSIHKALNCIANAPERKLRHRVQLLLERGSLAELSGADESLRRITLQPGEAWSDVAIADLKKIPPAHLPLWVDLLEHCQSATGGSASIAWLKKCRLLTQNVRGSELRKYILKWFPLVNQPRTQPVADYEPGYQPDPNLLIIEPHADMLKGLAWACGLDEDKDLARALTALALSAYRKVPMIGPRAVKIGNACVTTLGMMPGMEGIYQLAVLKVKVKFSTAQKFIEKAFDAAAERVKIPREDLEEMAVPAYGLTDVGRATEAMGDFTAELTVGHAVEIEWIRPDGKRTTNVPAKVKEAHGDDLKELKAAAKDIERMLPAQRERIDSLFLRQKTWPFPIWRERYLDHPLVGVLARRLLWDFTTGKRTVTGIWFDGRLVDLDLKAIDGLGAETKVRLWHPIDRTAEEIVAWRSWLDAQQIQQPFKQAHRELYVLTDAERATGVYSNRYAAHILRQHQFNALCALRGWKNKLRLLVDDEYPPASLHLPQWNLRAEFWIEGVGDTYGADTNDSGVFHYVSTDQVRFYALDAIQNAAHAGGGGYQTSDDPLPLDQIPPLVFSEVMRDVDMFVGVASVGNDPAWADGGPGGRYVDYWRDVSFGNLSATAKTRKDVLQRLVPKLKIASQCSFDEKFLVVKGSRRTYKIHLGSGNILMAPNDQYLCIVPKQSETKTGDVFLPFEGDRTLSVIISKAFLLAADSKITDSTILNQIRSK